MKKIVITLDRDEAIQHIVLSIRSRKTYGIINTTFGKIAWVLDDLHPISVASRVSVDTFTNALSIGNRVKHPSWFIENGEFPDYFIRINRPDARTRHLIEVDVTIGVTMCQFARHSSMHDAEYFSGEALCYAASVFDRNREFASMDIEVAARESAMLSMTITDRLHRRCVNYIVNEAKKNFELFFDSRYNRPHGGYRLNEVKGIVDAVTDDETDKMLVTHFVYIMVANQCIPYGSVDNSTFKKRFDEALSAEYGKHANIDQRIIVAKQVIVDLVIESQKKETEKPKSDLFGAFRDVTDTEKKDDRFAPELKHKNGGRRRHNGGQH